MVRYSLYSKYKYTEISFRGRKHDRDIIFKANNSYMHSPYCRIKNYTGILNVYNYSTYRVVQKYWIHITFWLLHVLYKNFSCDIKSGHKLFY